MKSDLSSLRWSEGFGNVVPTAILSVFLHRRYESEKRRVELTFVSASLKLFMKPSEEKSIQYARRHSWLFVATVTFLMIRESGDRAENSNFFLFAQKNPFGKLFSKIILKSSSEFLFWQENGKFEIGLNGPSDPM